MAQCDPVLRPPSVIIHGMSGLAGALEARAIEPCRRGISGSYFLTLFREEPDLTIGERERGDAGCGGRRERITRALYRDPSRDAAPDAGAFGRTPPLSF